ncbi:Ubiquitin-like superfamily protein [Euphorbia peplus]|nr:Ubiquitin-like superfamily protein [Euphorbia peplus]
MRSFFSRAQHKNPDANGSFHTTKTSHLRVLIEKRCLSPLSLDDDEQDHLLNGNERLVMRRNSYHKLPTQLFKLCVLKLDGSVFEVNVGRHATVGELKQAVEEVFTTSPKEGLSKISWSHVWGHFCLSYGGQKLIHDKTSIRNLGIKDGDQLQFVRHMSINCSNSKRRSRNQNLAHEPYPMLLSGNAVQEETEKLSTLGNSENNEDQNDEDSNQEEVPSRPEFKLAHFLKGWLSYSRLWGGSRKGSPSHTSRPSRFRSPLLASGPQIIELQG